MNEQTVEQKLLLIEYQAKQIVASGKSAIGKFAARLDTPSYAFEWSESAFKGAANVEVGQHILDIISFGRNEVKYTDEIIYNEIITGLRDKLRFHALYPKFSTSIPANLLFTLTGQAYAEFLDHFKWL